MLSLLIILNSLLVIHLGLLDFDWYSVSHICIIRLYSLWLILNYLFLIIFSILSINNWSLELEIILLDSSLTSLFNLCLFLLVKIIFNRNLWWLFHSSCWFILKLLSLLLNIILWIITFSDLLKSLELFFKFIWLTSWLLISKYFLRTLIFCLIHSLIFTS